MSALGRLPEQEREELLRLALDELRAELGQYVPWRLILRRAERLADRARQERYR